MNDNAKKSDADAPKPEIIIKKVPGGHGGAHGGAWKIALADMMTAMMAFFLLMWLLGATNAEKRKGLAEYFRQKTSLLNLSSQTGTSGFMAGKVLNEPDGFPQQAVQNSILETVVPVASTESTDRNKAPEGVTARTQENEEGVGKSGASTGKKAGGSTQDSGTGVKESPTEKPGSAKKGDQAGAGKADKGEPAAPDKKPASGPSDKGEKSKPDKPVSEMTEAEKKAAAATLDAKAFEKIEKDIKASMQQNPELSKVAGQMKFVRDREGLRIEIIDQADFAMFSIGTTNFLPKAAELMANVAKSIKDLPNHIAIRGHTDGFAYSAVDKMNNWRLSAQRADSTRRFLTGEGVDEKRFVRIEGVADREASVADNPLDPRNRRISITVLAQ